MTSPDRLLARLARQGGGRLLNSAIDKILPDTPGEGKAKRNLFAGLAGAMAMRVATRSVPGAIVVTSGLMAKKLYDRRKVRKGKAAATGQNTAPKA
ncbi:hypothetical protein RQP55_11615 [Novosphingobium sp. APW14]|uniref:hypothetical protein n=1 Tax=Novosphingobium sp. APW14 TaxID=3077237 RepID=UPI0028DD75AD|nr:hypothetical protein [Novosphingobium sp. APW14]MDT9014069.1 hypothetical protein [Novosphingobium sp. APW14]